MFSLLWVAKLAAAISVSCPSSISQAELMGKSCNLLVEPVWHRLMQFPDSVWKCWIFFVAQNVGELWRTDFLRCCCRALNLQLYSNSRAASSVQGRVAYPKGTFLRFHSALYCRRSHLGIYVGGLRPGVVILKTIAVRYNCRCLFIKGLLFFFAGEVANWWTIIEAFAGVRQPEINAGVM